MKLNDKAEDPRAMVTEAERKKIVARLKRQALDGDAASAAVLLMLPQPMPSFPHVVVPSPFHHGPLC
ncbi:MAG TPA: hypothetical protein VEJ63_05670 [Planctomycetota bacterium]|nr:hypothetical protein [Planctomycetota bacterium]